MRNHCIIYIWILVLFSTVSCGKIETEEVLGNANTVPVVLGILSDGDSINVILTQTIKPGVTPIKAPYPNARVYIAVKDSSWKELKRVNDTSNVFIDTTKNNKAQEGKTYNLKVVINNTTTLTATTTVPAVKAQVNDAYYMVTSENFGQPVISGIIKYSLPESDKYKYSCKIDYSNNTTWEFIMGTPNQTNFSYFNPSDSTKMIASIKTLNNDLYNFIYSRALESYNDDVTKVSAGIATAILSYKGTLLPYSNITNGYGLFSAYSNSNKVTMRRVNQ
jgi:Domain of unknown function (DUF4249)